VKLAAGLIDSITGCGWKAAALPSCRRGRATAHSCISEGPCAVLSRLNVQMDIWTWGRNTTPHAASQQACFPSQPHSVLAEPMLSNPCVRISHAAAAVKKTGRYCNCHSMPYSVNKRTQDMGLTSCVHTRLYMATPACAHRYSNCTADCERKE
jgi:hypothetical protein